MPVVNANSGFRRAFESVGAFGLNTARSLYSLMRIATAGLPVRPRFPTRGGSRVLILGSGPSLQASLRELPRERTPGLELLCVNDFYKEECFAELRPGMLAIADPAYWDDRCFDEYAGPLVAALANLDWPLTLFLPARARGTRLHRCLITRAVTFSLYSTAPVGGYGWLEASLFAAKLGMPRPQNVLVAAIALALWAGFEEIALVGADHSWHQEIEVDTENFLHVSSRHSYRTGTENKPFLKPGGIWKFRDGEPLAREDVFTMREIMTAWAAVHESYERLALLAQHRGAHIFNCSAMSFIDAFERRSLGNFLEQRASPLDNPSQRSAVPN
jgi:hypothetical protein